MLKISLKSASWTDSDQKGTAPLARNRTGPPLTEKPQTATRRNGILIGKAGRAGLIAEWEETVHFVQAKHPAIGILAGKLRQRQYDDDVQQCGTDEADEDGEVERYASGHPS